MALDLGENLKWAVVADNFTDGCLMGASNAN